MKALDEAEFCIVGTGLMGSSLALALRGHVKSLRGVDPNPAVRESARPYFDTVAPKLNAPADVIVLAAPIHVILNQLQSFAVPGFLPSGTLVMDLGSTKRDICALMDQLPEGVFAVGGHPMAGKEVSGPAAADAALFRNCMFVLCPTARTTPHVLSFAEQMINAIGARPLIMESAQHDEAVAAISHLPYLVSAGLVDAVNSLSGGDGAAVLWQLAASGFRDTSRLAGSDVTMIHNTLTTNRKAVLAALERYQERVAALHNLLASGDDSQLYATLEAIRKRRIAWGSAPHG